MMTACSLIFFTIVKKKLAERLMLPRVLADALHGMTDCYKIKLKASGYRLVYQVIEERVVVSVVAVGKRERINVYENAKNAEYIQPIHFSMAERSICFKT